MPVMKAYKVAAFTKADSGGSPTGVVLNTPEFPDEQLQFIADQIGLSHTAFVTEPTAESPLVGIRFFCPAGEILNCGHGTIAAHYAKIKHFNLQGNQILYQQAKNGIQQVEIVDQNNRVALFLKQDPIQFSTVDLATVLRLPEVLGINQDELAGNLPVVMASPGSNRFLIGISSLSVLNQMNPDFDQLKVLCQQNHAIGCFAYYLDPVNPTADMTARMFAPVIGINEDVINGNSSGCLGAHLLQLSGQHSLEIRIRQGHLLHQEGMVHVKVKRTDGHFETFIGGEAKIIEEISLAIPF